MARLEIQIRVLEFAAAACEHVDTIATRNNYLAKQIDRATTSTVLNTNEGVRRQSPGDKSNRYAMARGECAEAMSGLELAVRRRLLPEAEKALELGERCLAMLTRLVQAMEQRR